MWNKRKEEFEIQAKILERRRDNSLYDILYPQ